MVLSDYLDIKELNSMVEQGYIKCNLDGDYRIYNYTKACQFSKNWNPTTTKCRGLITKVVKNKEEIVAIPMRKFFNFQELPDIYKQRLVRTKFMDCYDKIDGCLAIMYERDKELCLSTRGDLRSPQALKATEFLRNSDCYKQLKSYWNKKLKGQWTLLFEFTSPEFPICINYGYEPALTFLGAVDNNGLFKSYDTCFTSEENLEFLEIWNNHKDRKVTAHQIVLDDEIEDFFNGTHRLMNRENAEGFVCRVGDIIFKLKQEDYLELARLREGITYGYLIDIVVRSHNNGDVIRAILKSELKQADDLEDYILDRLKPYREQYDNIYNRASEIYKEAMSRVNLEDVVLPEYPTEEQWKEYQNESRKRFFELIKKVEYKNVVVGLYERNNAYLIPYLIKRYMVPMEVETNE